MRKTVERGLRVPVDENPGGGMPADQSDMEQVEASGFDVHRIRKAGKTRCTWRKPVARMIMELTLLQLEPTRSFMMRF